MYEQYNEGYYFSGRLWINISMLRWNMSLVASLVLYSCTFQQLTGYNMPKTILVDLQGLLIVQELMSYS